MFSHTPFRLLVRQMASVSGDKDFIVSDIAHGFHLVKDMSFLSADFTNYGRAENPAVNLPSTDSFKMNSARIASRQFLKNLFVSTLLVVFKRKILASLDPLRT